MKDRYLIAPALGLYADRNFPRPCQRIAGLVSTPRFHDQGPELCTFYLHAPGVQY